MHRPSKAELFIKTLTEIRDEVRDRQIARLHMQHKVTSERFMQKFRHTSNNSRQSMDWATHSELTTK